VTGIHNRFGLDNAASRAIVEEFGPNNWDATVRRFERIDQPSSKPQCGTYNHSHWLRSIGLELRPLGFTSVIAN
jgi:hypothetical protein